MTLNRNAVLIASVFQCFVPAGIVLINSNNKNLFSGNDDLDQVLLILLGNPNFFGAVLACVLDNTIPGTVSDC